MSASDENPIYTLGHSNRGKDEFLQILFSHGIDTLVDVRRYPGSKKFPRYNEGNLRTYLPDAGVRYRHLGDDLGGYVDASFEEEELDRIRGWKAEGFKKYALYTETDAFQDGLETLIEWARDGLTAIMCAEAWYRKCHRQLIADQLVARDWTVLHIQGADRVEEHEPLDFVEIDGEHARY